jgi:uncharacterized protein (DUF2141 family)
MQIEPKPGIVFKFSRPSGAPACTPSNGMTDALRRLSETEEMSAFIAKARAQQRQVIVQVFHSSDGCPMLIHTATTPRKNRA